MTGFGQRKITSDIPFERAAAKIFVEANPETVVKIANKVMLKDADEVDVYLEITNKVAEGYYNKHPDAVVFKK